MTVKELLSLCSRYDSARVGYYDVSVQKMVMSEIKGVNMLRFTLSDKVLYADVVLIDAIEDEYRHPAIEICFHLKQDKPLKNFSFFKEVLTA